MDSQNSNTDNSNSQVTEGTNISEQGNDAQLVGFACEPKLDCPHFDKLSIIQLKELFEGMTQEILKQPCKDCNHVGENWVCLSCSELYCSRYINMDMSKHVEKYNEHCVGFSLSDGSFWCYQCDSYISNIIIKDLQVIFSDMKHGKDEEQKQDKDNDDADVAEIAEKLRDLLLLKEQEKQITPSDFTYEELVSGLKDIPQGKEVNDGNDKYNNRQFKNVVFMTGAGISVSAGIPDFRTPGSGLYSQLQKYNLPYPEAIFEINYFKKNPQAFYTLSKEFLTCGSHFTSSHYFIAQTNVKNRLLMNFSQNIDGLEIDAGLPEEKLVQAHGHFRTAKCTSCQAVADIQEFYEAAKTDKIHHCSTCQKGIVKPDIVFFGESLPPRFFSQLEILKNADLVFVMGTSLKVYPFAALVEMINENVPIVLVNRENPGIKRRRFLFLDGEIDDNVEKIMTDIGWDFPEIKRTYPAGTIIDDKKKQNL